MGAAFLRSDAASFHRPTFAFATRDAGGGGILSPSAAFLPSSSLSALPSEASTGERRKSDFSLRWRSSLVHDGPATALSRRPNVARVAPRSASAPPRRRDADAIRRSALGSDLLCVFVPRVSDGVRVGVLADTVKNGHKCRLPTSVVLVSVASCAPVEPLCWLRARFTRVASLKTRFSYDALHLRTPSVTEPLIAAAVSLAHFGVASCTVLWTARSPARVHLFAVWERAPLASV